MDPMAKPKGRSAGTAAVGRIRWLDEVADHDYAAAEADLSLKLDKPAVTRVVSRLRKAPTSPTACTAFRSSTGSTHTKSYR